MHILSWQTFLYFTIETLLCIHKMLRYQVPVQRPYPLPLRYDVICRVPRALDGLLRRADTVVLGLCKTTVIIE